MRSSGLLLSVVLLTCAEAYRLPLVARPAVASSRECTAREYTARKCAVRKCAVCMMDPPEQLVALMRDAEITPEIVEFQKTVEVIELNYDAKPVPFSVGDVVSEAGQNMGSAKILSLGKLAGLSEVVTLQLFGEIYQSVVATPEGDDHPNIRSFMKVGWDGVKFPDGPALVPKGS